MIPSDTSDERIRSDLKFIGEAVEIAPDTFLRPDGEEWYLCHEGERAYAELAFTEAELERLCDVIQAKLARRRALDHDFLPRN